MCGTQDKCHPQTIAVCQSRADGLGLKVVVGDEASFSIDKDVSGVLLQYPATDGSIHDYKVTHCPLLGLSVAIDASHQHMMLWSNCSFGVVLHEHSVRLLLFWQTRASTF